MTPRDQIGKTFTVKRAIDVALGDHVLVYNISTRMHDPKYVTELHLVGDDVEVWSFDRELFSTSMGNAVFVEARETS